MGNFREISSKNEMPGSADSIESQLEAFLSPVQPNPEFVHKLRTRLTREPSIVIERRNTLTAFVVTALGLFAGAFIVWIVLLIRSLLFREAETNAG